jgi:FkbM family methyltransferase
VEPAPETFSILRGNITMYPAQRAFQCLVTDCDGESYDFHIANNGGGSSSIMDLNMHRDIWPKVEFNRSIRLQGSTLPSLLRRESVDPSDFDVLVMDTQGSELLVLRGAESILENFRYIRTEAADFDAYSGGCRLAELTDFLMARGFTEVNRKEFASHPDGGRYYDVLFHRTAASGQPRR